MNRTAFIVIRRTPKPGAAVFFLFSLTFALFLFFGRNVSGIRLSALMRLDPEFYSHVSNLSISFLVMIIISFIWLAVGVTPGMLMIAAVLIALANYICEKWITFLNTPDMKDAYYGMAGVGLGVFFMLLTHYFGLRGRATGSASKG